MDTSRNDERLNDIYYRHGLARLEEQYRQGRGLDARAGTVAAIASALAAVAAFLVTDVPDPPPPIKWLNLTFVLALTVLGSFSAALGFCLRAISPRRSWYFDPCLDGFTIGPKVDPLLWAGDQVRDSVRENDKAITKKSKALFYAILCTLFVGASTVALGISIGYQM